MAGCTKQKRDEHQKKIKQAGLQDFKDWVEECACELNKANGQGDTRAIYDLVNQMEGRPKKPEKNLTEDEDGNMLKDAAAVAARWFSFLSEKFSATEAEQGRDPMPALPQAYDTLSDEEVMRAIDKLASGKACGPDKIPAEVYKNVPICREILAKLLQKI